MGRGGSCAPVQAVLTAVVCFIVVVTPPPVLQGRRLSMCLLPPPRQARLPTWLSRQAGPGHVRHLRKGDGGMGSSRVTLPALDAFIQEFQTPFVQHADVEGASMTFQRGLWQQVATRSCLYHACAHNASWCSRRACRRPLSAWWG